MRTRLLAGTISISLLGLLPAQVTVKVQERTYDWHADWGRPFAAGTFGEPQREGEQAAAPVEIGNTHGCMVVRKNGNILVNTDRDHAVVEFSPAGAVVAMWGKEYRGGLHGMCLREEDGKEVLYLTHTGRHELVKTTVDGKVLWAVGWPKQSGIYEKAGQYRPTAVAVAPDGRIYVGDGYGKSWVHVYDREHAYVKSFGGRGQADGKFRTPHGMWMDTRGETPLLLVCDRENHRLQWFTLDGDFVKKVELITDAERGKSRPCNVWPMPGGGLVVADLHGRITFLDEHDQVVAHVGENPDPKLRAKNRVERRQWQDGEFLSPHSVCVDGTGSIYVMDWNFLGRVSKLTPRAEK